MLGMPDRQEGELRPARQVPEHDAWSVPTARIRPSLRIDGCS